MKARAGGLRAIVAAAITVFVVGCGGGGGGDSGGASGPGPGSIKSADYWYDDPDTVAVFAQTAPSKQSGGEILRLTPIAQEATTDGPAWAWLSEIVSPDPSSGRRWMYASTRPDGIYTVTSQVPNPIGLERELPGTFNPGSRTETTTDAVLYDENGAQFPARLTRSMTATLLDSLALSRFRVANVLRVEHDYRYVLLQDSALAPGNILATRDTLWYGKGVGLVKAELGDVVPEGQSIPVGGVVELRGLRSPTRAIGALPGMTAVSHEMLIDTLLNTPSSGVTSANLSTRRARVESSMVVAGGSGFMVAAGFQVGNPFGPGNIPVPSPGGPGSMVGIIPPDPDYGGLLIMTMDQAGRLLTLRVGPVGTPLAMTPSAFAFDGSRFWLMGYRSTSPGQWPSRFVVRIAPDGQILDDPDQWSWAGCGVLAGTPNVPVTLAANGRSVVMASVSSQELTSLPDPMLPVQREYQSRIHWCSYDLDRQLLVSGTTPPVQGWDAKIRLTVSDSGSYVASMSMTDVPGSSNTSYAEIALDAYGNSLDATPRIVAGRAPENFDSGPADWGPAASDMGRFAQFVSSVAEPGATAMSESGTRAVLHEAIPELRSDAVLEWSLLVPEREGW